MHRVQSSYTADAFQETIHVRIQEYIDVREYPVCQAATYGTTGLVLTAVLGLVSLSTQNKPMMTTYAVFATLSTVYCLFLAVLSALFIYMLWRCKSGICVVMIAAAAAHLALVLVTGMF